MGNDRPPLRLAFRLVLSMAAFALSLPAQEQSTGQGSRVRIDRDRVLVIDDQKIFPIGFTMPPPPELTAPSGRNAIEELSDAGATFLRTGVMGGPWDDARIEEEQKWQDAAARYGLHCWVFLRELGSIEAGATAKEAMLRKVVGRFRNHPGMGVWKGVDEPDWGKQPVPPMLRAREIIRELDPDHPIAVTHAPRGTVESMRRYNPSADITGADIYPVGYPPGTHSLGANKQISMVGDYTRTMMDVAAGRLPVWMILQIAWSGVIKPGKTLRFPTFAEERFMVYQAICNGARGLMFFGGHIEKTWNQEDARFRWNWTFWRRVLRPVVEEIGADSPLYPALLASESTVPVRVKGSDVEFCVREVGRDLFIIACRREGPTLEVEFSGLPAWARGGHVLFEAPRTISASGGVFRDWFGPFEVHIYRFRNAAD
jgi:hypothetical protein